MQYTPKSPDFTDHVVNLARDYPTQWEAARERPDGSRDNTFARILAYLLNRFVDPKVGLNGKRGGDELSADALAYRNITAPGGAEVRDFIIGATHTPAWQDATNTEIPVLGRFIFPELTPDLRAILRKDHIHEDDQVDEPEPPAPVPVPTPGPGNPPPAPPADQGALQKVLEAMYEVLGEIQKKQELHDYVLAQILDGLVKLKLPTDTIVNLTILSERLKDAKLLDDIGAVRAQLDRGFVVESRWLGNPKIRPIPKP